MLKEEAVVTALEGPYAWVEFRPAGTCGSCGAKGCGTGALAAFFAARSRRLRVLNASAAQVGEEVIVGLSERALLQSSLLMYLAPLLSMFLGGGIAERLGGGSGGFTSLGALLGLAAGFGGVYLVSRKPFFEKRFQAEILPRKNS